jgi:hypothetical protein
MDNWHVRLNFNLSEEKGIKHHSYKEHHKICINCKIGLRNIAKMQNLYVNFVFRTEIVTIFGSNMQNMQTSQGYIFRILQHFVTKFCNFTNFNKFFTGIYFFLPR